MASSERTGKLEVLRSAKGHLTECVVLLKSVIPYDEAAEDEENLEAYLITQLEMLLDDDHDLPLSGLTITDLIENFESEEEDTG